MHLSLSRRLSRLLPVILASLALLHFHPSTARALTFNNWSSSGPAPTAAPVKALVVTPPPGTATVYVGTDGGGIYKMSDGGALWAAANGSTYPNILTNRQLQGLAVDPINPLVIYAATKSGLFKSTDGGTSWNPVNTGLTNSDIRGIAIHPQTTNIVYAATAGGVFISVNSGANWSAANGSAPHNLTTSNIRGIAIDTNTPATLYAATDAGIFKSSDSATSWDLYSTGLTNTDVLSVAFAATATSTLFAGTNGGGVFISTDGAATWTADNSGLGNMVINRIAIDPTTDTTRSIAYAGTANGLFNRSYTTPPGSWGSWSARDTGITTPANVQAIAIVNANGSFPSTTLYAGTDYGVFRSANSGAAWSPLSSGLLRGRAITIHPTDPTQITAGFGSGGIFHSTSRGDSWAPSMNGLTNLFVKAVIHDPTTPATMYAGTGAGVYKTTDSGATWNTMNTGLSNTNVRWLAIDPNAPHALYAATGGGVFKWDSVGSTWGAFNTGLTNLDVNTIAFYNTSLYAGTNGGGVFLSDSGGAWSQMITGMGNSIVNVLAIDQATGVIYAGTSVGVYKSSDFALHWNAVNSGITTVDVRALALNQTAPPAPAAALKVIAAGTTGGGVFLTTSGGTSWNALNTRLVDKNVNALAMDDKWPPYIHAATDSKVYDIELNPTIHITPASGASFGNADILSHPSTQEYTIANTGTLDLTVNTITATPPGVSPAFALGGSAPCSSLPPVNTNLVLAPGTSCTFLFSFTPPLVGAGSATLTFASDVVSSPTDVVLNWTGIDPPPTSAITAPLASPPPIQTPPGYAITGTASDVGSGLLKVQVSINSGAWQDASTSNGWANWTYSWTPAVDGAYTIQARATDNASPNNVQSPPTSVTVNVDNTPPTAVISQPGNNAALRGTSVTISGTAADPVSAGSGVKLVEVSTDGVTWQTATGTNNWSYTWTLPADGAYNLRARVTDNAGNQGLSAIVPVIVDKTAPQVAITAPSPGTTLPPGTGFTVAGTASDPGGSGISLVEVTFDSGTTWFTADYAAGNWTYPWTLPINGTYSIQARTTDLAGNVASTPVISAIVNNPLPNTTITSPTSGAFLNGIALTITGTAILGHPTLALSRVEVSIDGAPWQAAAGTSTWTFTTPLPATYAPSFSIRARAIDSIGNTQNPTTDIVVTVDNVKPTSAITTPATAAYLRGTSTTIQGTSSDTGLGVQRVELSFDGGSTWQLATGTATWSYNWNLPTDGLYIIMSRAVDNIVGNVQSPPASITVTVDNTPPHTSITLRPANPSNTATPTFQFTANETSTFRCQVDSGVDFACTSPYTFPTLSAGPHVFKVYAIDLAGNADPTPPSYAWTIDLIRPAPTIVSPTNGTKRISVSGTVIKAGFNKDLDPTTVTSSTFYLDNGATGTVTYDPATRTATLTPTGRLAYTTTYTATLSTGIADPAANTLAANYTWTFSTDPDGDINLDGKVDIADALYCLQVAVGRQTPTAQQLLHGDVGPLQTGKPLPDGKINVSDAVVILEKVVGISSW